MYISKLSMVWCRNMFLKWTGSGTCYLGRLDPTFGMNQIRIKPLIMAWDFHRIPHTKDEIVFRY
jgi:hypothetical protein